MKYLAIIAILFFSLNNTLIAQTTDNKKVIVTEIKKLNKETVSALIRATELEPKITALESAEKDKARKEKLNAWLTRFKNANTDYEKWMEQFSSEAPTEETALLAGKERFQTLKTQITTLAIDGEGLISK
jgi:uncharacterized protein YlxW (UPF0749 family)